MSQWKEPATPLLCFDADRTRAAPPLSTVVERIPVLSLLKTSSDLERWRITPVGRNFCPMVGFYRGAIEAARRARRALVWECFALQHQSAVLKRRRTRRLRFRPIDRLFWVFMSWWRPAWRDALKVIQPETILRWRHGIALIWKYRSHGRSRGGRARIALETRQLIREMARANFLWGAPRIHGELLKLGITVSQATVSRYMPPSGRDRRSQAWRTFIRNQAIGVVQSRSFNAQNW